VTTTNEHRRKIRDSCNNCSGQKIRCGKQRPACARCATKKLQCNYSYSQRTGRRSSSMNSATKDAPNVAFLPAIPDSPTATCDPSAMFGSALSLESSTSPKPAQASDYPMDSPMEFATSPFDDPTLFPDLNFDFLVSPSDNTAPSISSSNGAAETAEQKYIDSDQLWQNLPNANSVFNYDTLKTVSAHPIFDKEQIESFRKTLSQVNQRGHDCMALALQVVNDLSVMREPCMTSISDPMACMDSSKAELRDVDTVLFINRDAAQSVKRILDCTCSNDQAVSMACYLATTKIVDWYGAAIEAVGERAEDKERFSKISLTSKSSQGAMADRIIARPIFMGKYCLDSEVQRVVRAQVVLGELKEHVQPLLDLLPKYHITALGADVNSAAASVGPACVLRTQLRAVIQSARNLNGTG
jgi:hypothetical protein